MATATWNFSQSPWCKTLLDVFKDLQGARYEHGCVVCVPETLCTVRRQQDGQLKVGLHILSPSAMHHSTGVLYDCVENGHSLVIDMEHCCIKGFAGIEPEFEATILAKDGTCITANPDTSFRVGWAKPCSNRLSSDDISQLLRLAGSTLRFQHLKSILVYITKFCFDFPDSRLSLAFSSLARLVSSIQDTTSMVDQTLPKTSSCEDLRDYDVPDVDNELDYIENSASGDGFFVGNGISQTVTTLASVALGLRDMDPAEPSIVVVPQIKIEASQDDTKSAPTVRTARSVSPSPQSNSAFIGRMSS